MLVVGLESVQHPSVSLLGLFEQPLDDLLAIRFDSCEIVQTDSPCSVLVSNGRWVIRMGPTSEGVVDWVILNLSASERRHGTDDVDKPLARPHTDGLLPLRSGPILGFRI